MKKPCYQLSIPDKNCEIRKAVAKIRRNTGLDEAVIIEKLLKDAIAKIPKIFIQS
ncbi:MAG: hypothetical protein PHV82_07160 [Victivallaceae bacterium]|nr:hypothetical protein [Victivallaceae bacterium]